MGKHSCGRRSEHETANPPLLPDLPPDEDPSLMKTKENLRKSREKTTVNSNDDRDPEQIMQDHQQLRPHAEGTNNTTDDSKDKEGQQEEEDEMKIREQPIKLILAIHKEILQHQSNSNITLLSYLKKEDVDKTGFVNTEMFMKAVKRATAKLPKRFKKVELSTLDALAIFNHYGKESDGRLNYKKFMKVLGDNTDATVGTSDGKHHPENAAEVNVDTANVENSGEAKLLPEDVHNATTTEDVSCLYQASEEADAAYVDENGLTWSVAPSSSSYATSTSEAARQELENKIVGLADHLAQLSEHHWAYSLPPISWAGRNQTVLTCIFMSRLQRFICIHVIY